MEVEDSGLGVGMRGWIGLGWETLYTVCVAFCCGSRHRSCRLHSLERYRARCYWCCARDLSDGGIGGEWIY